MVIYLLSERTKRLQTRLDAYYEAELAILAGQEYKIGTRMLKRADLAAIREAIHSLEIQLDQSKAIDLGQGPRKVFRITPRDL